MEKLDLLFPDVVVANFSVKPVVLKSRQEAINMITSLHPRFSQLFQEVLGAVLPGVTGDTAHDTPHR